MMPAIDLAPEVEAALAEGRAVVALESTLIAHGLPWPANLEAGRALEEAVRAEGAAPATVAVLDGRLRVGLDATSLERVARGGRSVGKASARDLGPALASGAAWATTVAATMRAAALAGVRLFATGGIGGVHRGADSSFDESADLVALASYPVALVCAGAKAILDLPRTFERLETLGITVLGLGTRELPAFYHNQSGIPLEHVAETPAEGARVLFEKYDRLGDRGGTVIVSPVPREKELAPRLVDEAIARALARAARAGVRGKALTPFLLGALAEETGGSAVETNVALVASNARAAARIAVEYSRLRSAA